MPLKEIPRLLSLWDIMNLFDVCSLSHILHQITQVQMGLSLPKMMGQGNRQIDGTFRERAESAMEQAEQFFQIVQMQDCLQFVQSAKEQWDRPMLDMSAAGEIMYRLGLDIVRALDNRQFLRVADDRSNLLMYEQGSVAHWGALSVFGDTVKTAFPSTEADITEAGNCLASECNTAAVFHLMRIAEAGLRAVAKDRNASFANKPLEQQEWGAILGFLDGSINQLRQAAGNNWPDQGVKDIQIRFYSEVVAELRAFNEAWRKHLSHARADGIYDRDYAMSVFKHVRTFMRKLAEKISEHSTTPQYWTVV